MKKTTKTGIGTSFYKDVFFSSVSDLRKILGEPIYEDNKGDDKVNFEWEMETDNGDVFTVYDWKEYREIDEYEIIEWHIGGDSGAVTADALAEIKNALEGLE